MQPTIIFIINESADIYFFVSKISENCEKKGNFNFHDDIFMLLLFIRPLINYQNSLIGSSIHLIAALLSFMTCMSSKWSG